jgi:hypothetical protein
MAVWLAVSAACLATVLAPFALSQSSLAAVVPRCERQVREGRPCVACGLTRSYYAMSRGEWGAAAEHNRAGPALYVAFWANSVGAVAFALFHWRS